MAVGNKKVRKDIMRRKWHELFGGGTKTGTLGTVAHVVGRNRDISGRHGAGVLGTEERRGAERAGHVAGGLVGRTGRVTGQEDRWG